MPVHKMVGNSPEIPRAMILPANNGRGRMAIITISMTRFFRSAITLFISKMEEENVENQHERID